MTEAGTKFTYYAKIPVKDGVGKERVCESLTEFLALCEKHLSEVFSSVATTVSPDQLQQILTDYGDKQSALIQHFAKHTLSNLKAAQTAVVQAAQEGL
ncbi:hypothetical protein [Candidatus Bathycorpusculum sp.]|uniref:hypothetical protein n=1 Tax=Candidatus Bathycorpusculum sp. TaxID=2994959 RepID=UPI00282F1DCC|nr:hypothetical protein [Candidatus Termitimicrobium sp.]MCL2432071.1 hypothetical protein [Candidatus Termitimicrobium sp.]